MGATEFIGGLLVGAVIGTYAKDKLFGDSSNQELQKKQRDIDSLLTENDKFRTRNKEAERQMEDLLAENQKLRRHSKDNDDSRDDLADDLQHANREVKKLRLQNEELARKIQEYKTACNNYEIEIQHLKEK